MAEASGNFQILAADDSAWVATGTASNLSAPVRTAMIRDMLFIEGDSGRTIYGGSRKTASYNTGTVAVTEGSKTVTGTGTAWSANVDAGMILVVSGGRTEVVQSVDSNTGITLAQPYGGATGTGLSYDLHPIHGGESARCLAAISRRLARVRTAFPTHVEFSEIDNPNDYVADDFHTFPSEVNGLYGLRDTLLVFTTTAGVYAVSNMALDLTDSAGNVQQRVEKVNDDLLLWHRTGIASWRGVPIVPAQDGVWLMDSISSPTLISGAITDLYRSYVSTAGYRPGAAAVYKNHYLLPIIDSSNNVQDTLVCRLSPTRAGGALVWSRLSGSGRCISYASRSATASVGPKLLGAPRSAARVLMASFLEPAAATKNDMDSTAPTFELHTRDFGLGNMTENVVRFIRLRYELTDAASDNPTISAYYAEGDDGAWTQLSGNAPEDPTGQSPHTWPVNVAARYLRFRFVSNNASASLRVRGLEVFVLKAGDY